MDHPSQVKRLHDPQQFDGVVHHQDLVHLFADAEVGVEHVLQGSVVTEGHDQDANRRVGAPDGVAAADEVESGGLNDTLGVRGVDPPGETLAHHPFPSREPRGLHLDCQAPEALVVFVRAADDIRKLSLVNLGVRPGPGQAHEDVLRVAEDERRASSRADPRTAASLRRGAQARENRIAGVNVNSGESREAVLNRREVSVERVAVERIRRLCDTVHRGSAVPDVAGGDGSDRARPRRRL